jgi:hypothetical protein
MTSYKLAVLGVICFIAGLILFFAAGSLIFIGTYCGSLLNNIIMNLFSVFCEITTGMLLLGGLILLFTNLGIRVSGNSFRTAVIVLVVACLFILGLSIIGVFRQGAFLGTNCIASSGYYCSGLSLSACTGKLSVTVGQSTGVNWAGAVFAYAPQGTSTTNGIPNVPATGVSGDYVMPSGLTQGLVLNVTNPQNGTIVETPVGRYTSGAIWACYSTIGAVIPKAFNNMTSCGNYAQIAVLTIKATTH